MEGRVGCALLSIHPGPFLLEPLRAPNASHMTGGVGIRCTKGPFGGSHAAERPLNVSRRSLDREVVAVVLSGAPPRVFPSSSMLRRSMSMSQWVRAGFSSSALAVESPLTRKSLLCRTFAVQTGESLPRPRKSRNTVTVCGAVLDALAGCRLHVRFRFPRQDQAHTAQATIASFFPPVSVVRGRRFRYIAGQGRAIPSNVYKTSIISVE